MIEPEITAESKQNDQTREYTEPAILMHRVVNPVASARIPDNAADVAEENPAEGWQATVARRRRAAESQAGELGSAQPAVARMRPRTTSRVVEVEKSRSGEPPKATKPHALRPESLSH